MDNELNAGAKVWHVVCWGCIASANAQDAKWVGAAYIILGAATMILALATAKPEPQK